MNRTVTIRIRDVYGVPTYYPVNSAAHHFAEIAGTKTLRPRDLSVIRELGFTIETEQREVLA